MSTQIMDPNFKVGYDEVRVSFKVRLSQPSLTLFINLVNFQS